MITKNNIDGTSPAGIRVPSRPQRLVRLAMAAQVLARAFPPSGLWPQRKGRLTPP